MGLFSLIFTLGVNKKPLEQGLGRAKADVSSFGSQIKGHLAGVFTTGAVMAWVKSIQQATGRIKDLGEQTGLSTDEVQKTDFALKQSGLQFEELINVMNRLGQARRDAVEGNKELRATFERYGLSVQQLNDPQLRNYDLLRRIAIELGKANPTAREQAEIMDLMGTRAGKLANILGELEKIKPPAMFTNADIERIDKMAKAFENLVLTLQVRAAPVLTGILENFRKSFGELTKGNLVKAWAANPLNPFGGAINVGRTMGKHQQDDQRNKAVKFAEEMANLAMGVMGINGGAGGPGLFEVDRDVKDAAGRSVGTRGGGGGRGGDALVAVGNFLGSDPGAMMRKEMKTQTDKLEKIERNTKQLAAGAVVIRK